jgi:hypothetical protein
VSPTILLEVVRPMGAVDPLPALVRGSEYKRDEPSNADSRKDRDRGLRRSRRENELEERHRISPFGLHRARWAAPAADHERAALHE